MKGSIFRHRQKWANNLQTAYNGLQSLDTVGQCLGSIPMRFRHLSVYLQHLTSVVHPKYLLTIYLPGEYKWTHKN